MFITLLPILALMAATSLLAQEFTFEVASVKATSNPGTGTSIWTNENGFRTENVTLKNLVQVAFNAQHYQVSGGPNWVTDDHWDINARNEVAEVDKLPASDRKSLEARNLRMQERVRHLLEERFQLKVREELKELPVYALTLNCIRTDPRQGWSEAEGRDGSQRQHEQQPQ